MRRAPFTPLYYEYKLVEELSENCSARATYNVAVLLTHAVMLKNAKLTGTDREDLAYSHLSVGKLTAFTLFKSKRLNVDFTDDMWLKLKDIKHHYKFTTEAQTISFCVRSLYKYKLKNDLDIGIKWESLRERVNRGSKDLAVRVSFNLPIEVYQYYQVRADTLTKKLGALVTYRELMAKDLTEVYNEDKNK